MTSGPTPVARGGFGAKAPPLAARLKRRVLELIPGQLEASFLIFLTLGSKNKATLATSIAKKLRNGIRQTRQPRIVRPRTTVEGRKLEGHNLRFPLHHLSMRSSSPEVSVHRTWEF